MRFVSLRKPRPAAMVAILGLLLGILAPVIANSACSTGPVCCPHSLSGKQQACCCAPNDAAPAPCACVEPAKTTTTEQPFVSLVLPVSLVLAHAPTVAMVQLAVNEPQSLRFVEQAHLELRDRGHPPDLGRAPPVS